MDTCALANSKPELSPPDPQCICPKAAAGGATVATKTATRKQIGAAYQLQISKHASEKRTMLLILKLLYVQLNELHKYVNRDPRVAHLPLLGSPLPAFTIIALYLLLVKKVGPKLMAHREPFDVKLPMQIYNVMQILLNIYVLYESIRYSYMQQYFSFSCQEVNTQDVRPSIMRLRYPAYVYYISKYLDLLDTVFFVLRKKYNQVSLLHVYHHAAMIFAVWNYVTLHFASHYTIIGVVNAFIHICMYTYYFSAALQLPGVDLMPWKRLLTQLQIVQFCYFTIHISRALFNNWCGLELGWLVAALVENLLMLVLFSEFYYKTYVSKGRQERKSKQAGNGSLRRKAAKVD